MPLNIDLQQIALHFFNFFVLALGLYVLLYSPVKKFMDQRQEALAQMEEEAQKKLHEAQVLAQDREEALAQVKAQSESYRQEIMAQAQREAEEEVKRAKKEGRSILEAARLEAQEERDRALREGHQQIKALVLEKTRTALRGDQDPFDEFIEAVDDHE
ncbi:MAG: ATP synthase F0 subunit B [Tissierellia bacterium]|nr:ATP synthase F0 subunit B [Tissierellia bacterium]